jgi:hypothetical protein
MQSKVMRGATVDICLTPAQIVSPGPDMPATIVCQTHDDASNDLHRKLAAQLIERLGEESALELCRTNNWDAVLVHIVGQTRPR